MAGLKDIKKKITSISNTRKITRTMEMVAAAKSKQTIDRVEASTPYSSKLTELLLVPGVCRRMQQADRDRLEALGLQRRKTLGRKLEIERLKLFSPGTDTAGDLHRHLEEGVRLAKFQVKDRGLAQTNKILTLIIQNLWRNIIA